jgi:ABC-type antimicrobial peptide transport system permease subunit
VTRFLLLAVGLLVGLWLLGAVAQGLLVSTSLTARKIWLFTWLWERFALGLVIGLVIGFLAALLVGRRRPSVG